MKIPYIKLKYLLLACSLFVYPFFAQAQHIGNINIDDEYFNYSVKVPEEFVERFNDDPNSYIRQVYRESNKPFTLSRTQLLLSLINLDNPELLRDTNMLGDFFRHALSTQKPVKLNFLDSNWFAEATCVFTVNRKQYEIPVFLRVLRHEDKWAKWIIAGVGDTIKANNKLPDVSITQHSKDTFISTASNSTDFLEFYDIFRKGTKLRYFFDEQALKSKNGKSLVENLQKGNTTFHYVKKITYHYFEVPEWTFSVSHFDRRSKNAGWLINKIAKVPETEKSVYISNMLARKK